MELCEESSRLERNVSMLSEDKKSDIKPASFKELVGRQHSSGYWPAACKQMLNTFVKGGDCASGVDVIMSQIKALTANQEDVLMTLIALFILQEKFEDREEEWTLLAKKAKTWLKQVGVAKPDSLVAALNLIIQ